MKVGVVGRTKSPTFKQEISGLNPILHNRLFSYFATIC